MFKPNFVDWYDSLKQIVIDMFKELFSKMRQPMNFFDIPSRADDTTKAVGVLALCQVDLGPSTFILFQWNHGTTYTTPPPSTYLTWTPYGLY